MIELLKIPKSKRRVFKKHFLNSVHVEIAFPPIEVSLLLEKEGELKKSYEGLGYAESQKVFQGIFSLKHGDLSQEKKDLGLVFISKEPNRSFQILIDKVIFSDFAYQGFESFHETLSILIQTFRSNVTACEF